MIVIQELRENLDNTIVNFQNAIKTRPGRLSKVKVDEMLLAYFHPLIEQFDKAITSRDTQTKSPTYSEFTIFNRIMITNGWVLDPNRAMKCSACKQPSKAGRWRKDHAQTPPSWRVSCTNPKCRDYKLP